MLIPYLVYQVGDASESKISTDLPPHEIEKLNEFLHRCGVLVDFEDLLYVEEEE